MRLFESITWPEGFVAQFLGIFRFGIGGALKPDDGQGAFTTIIFGLWKLNCSVSIEWRKHAKLDKNTW